MPTAHPNETSRLLLPRRAAAPAGSVERAAHFPARSHLPGRPLLHQSIPPAPCLPCSTPSAAVQGTLAFALGRGRPRLCAARATAAAAASSARRRAAPATAGRLRVSSPLFPATRRAGHGRAVLGEARNARAHHFRSPADLNRVSSDLKFHHL